MEKQVEIEIEVEVNGYLAQAKYVVYSESCGNDIDEPFGWYPTDYELSEILCCDNDNGDEPTKEEWNEIEKALENDFEQEVYDAWYKL